MSDYEHEWRVKVKFLLAEMVLRVQKEGQISITAGKLNSNQSGKIFAEELKKLGDNAIYHYQRIFNKKQGEKDNYNQT